VVTALWELPLEPEVNVSAGKRRQAPASTAPAAAQADTHIALVRPFACFMLSFYGVSGASCDPELGESSGCQCLLTTLAASSQAS
jgi:hypothetical protein